VSAWPPFAAPVTQVTLRLPGARPKALTNLSAAARQGDALFLADDEGASFSRLVPAGDEWVRDAEFALADLLDLAWPDEEPDLEGLAVEDGWLWIVGSHARTREKVEKAEGETIDLDALADLRDGRARCLLARVPLVEVDGRATPVRRDGARRAGMVRQGKRGGALAKALRRDALLRPFTKVPAKEGGVDVEGIAACGSRVALGLRGPVVGGHALLLELSVDAKKGGRLALGDTPVKRLLALEGLGIRDLKRLGDDLLILAGPTTGLDGPCALYRWRGWANDPPRDPQVVRLHRPERVLELPFGRGEDHPEGLALWDDGGVLVVCDSPARPRCDAQACTLRADVYAVA
jgi:hypothetical protein